MRFSELLKLSEYETTTTHRMPGNTWSSFNQSVQSLSCVQLFATLWIAPRQASLSTNSWSLLKLMSIKWVMPSSHLILSCPLLLLPPIPHSIRVFSNESTLCMRWPKYWSFSFSISPSKEHPGLISFRMDWLDLLPFKGLFSNTIVQKHQFFGAQLSSQSNSHPYMTTGNTIALTRRIFVGKVISLLFNILSRLVITFLPRNKCLLISWLQSPSAVISEPPKIKSDTVSPSNYHEVMGPDDMILVFWTLSFKPTFSLFHFHQEALSFFFTFYHKGSVICISEVIDISPSNLDSSLCFIQSGISHDVFCI